MSSVNHYKGIVKKCLVPTRHFFTITNKFRLIFIASFLLNMIGNAQTSIGIASGFSLNYINENNLKNLSYTAGNPQIGGHGTAMISHKINRHISLSIQPCFIQERYKLTRTGPYTGIYTNFKNSFLKLPVMLEYNIGRSRLHYFAEIGFFTGFWINGSVNGNIPNILNIIVESTNFAETDNVVLEKYHKRIQFTQSAQRWQWGCTVGIGAKFNLTANKIAFLKVGNFNSFLCHNKEEGITKTGLSNNQTILYIGYMYTLKSK